ncbi:MAG TPA: SCP2 sterol-binding domain-containing protein [Polyangiaceae bacterium]|nr:SCP2 sterol-binding domain-containing protein [Polyangiaceae bacterium]
MQISSAREYFEAVTSRPHPELSDASGTWEFDVEGAGSWWLMVDGGKMRVSDRPPPEPAKTRVRLTEAELLRLARGEGHENLLTALLRGALRVEGDLRFGQKLESLLPLPEEAPGARPDEQVNA